MRRSAIFNRYRFQRLFVLVGIVTFIITVGLHILPSDSSDKISSIYHRKKEGHDFENFDWADEDYSRLLKSSENAKAGQGSNNRSPSDKNYRPIAAADELDGKGDKSQGGQNGKGRRRRQPVPSKKKKLPSGDPTGPQHTYREDGLMEVNPRAPHPLFDLIRHAEEAWQAKLDKASQTLEEAVVEYKRRYGRLPPTGFDKWWEYVVANDVQLPDEYDQIHRDLEPFWGIRSADIRERQEVWEANQEGTYTIANEDGHVYMAGHSMPPGAEDVAETRAGEQVKLLRQVQEWIPDFRATFTAHDVPYQFIGNDQVSDAIEAAASGEYLESDQKFDTQALGWASACAPSSPLRAQDPDAILDVDELWDLPKTFIHDHKKAMDPCMHPTHAHLNGFLKAHGRGPAPREKLVPAFTMCTTSLHADILSVAVEQWTENMGSDPEWKDKRNDKLLWRGSNTGIYFSKDKPWNISQRIRLVGAANERSGYLEVLKPMSNPKTPVGKPQKATKRQLNSRLLDIAFAGYPIQCDEELCETVFESYEFRDKQSFAQSYQYKYILDIDGNGWSARFKRLMTSNSLILKSTIFPEWYTDRIMPWVHYVPIKNDLTDIYDVMSFFKGDAQGEGAHDGLAEMIATQGKEWSKTFWRKEDMVAYTFRLFLEYARVSSPDRDNMNFNLSDIE